MHFLRKRVIVIVRLDDYWKGEYKFHDFMIHAYVIHDFAF